MIKDGEYVINLDEQESIRTHWIALHLNGDNVTYLDCFGVKPKSSQEIERLPQILIECKQMIQ